MFDWFRKRRGLPLAPAGEREAMLATRPATFREVDAAFHAYLGVIAANPGWDDHQIEEALIRGGLDSRLVEECVTFGPLAWGREIVEHFGVSPSPLYRLAGTTESDACDRPLAREQVYVWARALIRLYRTAERNELFQVVACRSAEVDALNNALNGGVDEADLRGGHLDPPTVHFRHAGDPGGEPAGAGRPAFDREQARQAIPAADRTITPLERITERVNRHGDPNDGDTPRPLLTLAEFFDGNSSVGSIGCNLARPPEPAEFRSLLEAIAARPEVAEVRVQVTMFDEPEDWPYSDTVWVITRASPEEVLSWFGEEVRPDDCWRGWTNGVTFEACPVPPGMAPVACWWD